jgi:hypothetical protein
LYIKEQFYIWNRTGNTQFLVCYYINHIYQLFVPYFTIVSFFYCTFCHDNNMYSNDIYHMLLFFWGPKFAMMSNINYLKKNVTKKSASFGKFLMLANIVSFPNCRTIAIRFRQDKHVAAYRWKFAKMYVTDTLSLVTGKPHLISN